MADTDDRKTSTRRESRKPTRLAQEEDDYFSRGHDPATHGEDPLASQRYGDV